MTIYTTVYSKCQPDTGKPLVVLRLCAQIQNQWDPGYQKNYLYISRLISYPYGILLLPTTSNTSLQVDIQDYFLKYHGYEFIFKNERNRLDRKGKITFMIFVSVQIYSMCWNWFLWGCQCKESNSGISCLLYVLQTGMAVQQGQSWTRESTVLHFHFFQYQSESKVITVIWIIMH